MPDSYIVTYCSPTLAGLKTGSLFSIRQGINEINAQLREVNRRITRFGLRMVPLRIRKDSALLYLYRPDRLRKDLSDPEARKILGRRGYPENSEKCVAKIASHLQKDPSFPHEIGLFLSYPPADVTGFIEHPDTGVKAVGCWKVYGDEVTAKETFRKYDICTDIYQAAVAKGRSLEQLIVNESAQHK